MLQADEPRDYRKSKAGAMVSGSLARVGSAASRGRRAEFEIMGTIRRRTAHDLMRCPLTTNAQVAVSELRTEPTLPAEGVSNKFERRTPPTRPVDGPGVPPGLDLPATRPTRERSGAVA